MPAGFFFWQRQAFDLLHTSFDDIVAVFLEYCKRGATGAKDTSAMFSLSAREWVSLCKVRGRSCHAAAHLAHAQASLSRRRTRRGRRARCPSRPPT